MDGQNQVWGEVCHDRDKDEADRGRIGTAWAAAQLQPAACRLSGFNAVIPETDAKTKKKTRKCGTHLQQPTAKSALIGFFT